MILTTIPFAKDMNLGREYNRVMACLPSDGWACLLDHDAMFTTPCWHDQLEAAIAAHPDGSFTAKTNRIYSTWQQVSGSRLGSRADDITEHRKIGAGLAGAKFRAVDITEMEPGWGGVLMLVSRRAWNDAGGFQNGMMCCDHQFHYALRRAGRRVYCIEGLYVYHYRGTSRGDVSGFPRAKSRLTGKPCAHRYEP